MADITGTINGTTSNSQIKSRILWEETTDAATNTGSVTATLQLRTLTGYQTYSGDSDFYLRINGVTYSTISIYKSVGPGDAWVTCYTKTVTGIAHNTDGTKSIAISGLGNMYGTSVSTITVGGTVALYAIPRASTFSTTSSVEVNGTNAVAVTITRMVATHTHTVDIYTGADYATSTYKQRYTGIATSQSFAIPIAWRLAMPTTTSMTARVTVTTYSGATQIGDALTHTFTLRVPATVKPVLYVNGMDGGNIQTSPSQPTAILEFEHYVQGYSGIKARFRNLASAFESEVAISEYFVTYAGVKSSMTPDAAEYDTVYAKAAGDVAVVLQLAGVYTFTVGVTDARGMTTTANVSITCFDYDDPSLTNIDVFRCDSAGVASDTGTYISVKAKALIATLGGENAVTYLRAQYKVTSASTYGAWSNLTSNVALVVGAGAILTTQSYDVRFQIQDTVGNASYPQVIVPTSDVAFNLRDGGRGVGFGKYAEADELADFDYPVKAPSGEITGALAVGTLSLDTPLGYANGGLPSTTEAGVRTEIKTNLKTYTTVAQLGFSAGVPTINEVYASMPNDSTIMCYAGEFASGQTPSLYGFVEIAKSSSTNRAKCLFNGKESGSKDYRLYLLPGGTFDSSWKLNYNRANISDMLTDLGIATVSTTTTAVTPTLGTVDLFYLYKIGKVVTFNMRYTTTISATGTEAAIIPTAYRPSMAYVALKCYSSGTNPFDHEAYVTDAGTIKVRLGTAVTDLILSGSWITA